MRILVISDLHAPFNHPHAVDFLAGLRRVIRPQAVVCIGDEIDAHGWSRHDRNPNAPGQSDELEQAKATLRRVYKLFPRVRVCNSNHVNRHLRKLIRAGVPSQFARAYKEVIKAPPGWVWADRHVVDGITFLHGEGYSGQNAALAAAMKQRCCAVIGHVHSWAAIQYHSNGADTIWGMNVGCLVDPHSVAMEYAKTGQNAQTLGTGAVIDHVPVLYPLSS